VIRLQEVDSTNTFALGLVRSAEAPEGTVVSARIQNMGRGQRGNSWFSEPGKNITCSIILRPAFLDPSRQFDLIRAVALGVSDLLMNLLPDFKVQIKWPNDILVDGKKICGILIENSLNGNQLSASVVGIGINLNQSEFSLDTPHVVSFYCLTKKTLDPESVMQEMFGCVEARYLQLRNGPVTRVRDDYESRLFRKGVLARYTDFKTIFNATLEFVSPDGFLVLVDEFGQERRFGFREIGQLF
jgi:BirA family biotin operon repressor/biotin-[acetyl-CoA-carboxylase] ligase